MALALSSPSAWTQSFEFRSSDNGDFGRLEMDWGRTVPVTVTGDSQQLRLRAAEPMVGSSLAVIIDPLQSYIIGMRIAPGGQDLALDLAQPVAVTTALINGAAVLDFRPAATSTLNGATLPSPLTPTASPALPSFSGVELNLPPIGTADGAPPPVTAPPTQTPALTEGAVAAPSSATAPSSTTVRPTQEPAPAPILSLPPVQTAQSPAQLEEPAPPVQTPTTAAAPTGRSSSDVRVRVGQHDAYSRIVFDWPTPISYSIERVGETVSIAFDRPANVSLAAIDRFNLRTILGGRVLTNDPLRVAITVPQAAVVRHFVSEASNIAIDVSDNSGSRPAVPSAPIVARVTPDAPTPAVASATPPNPSPEAAAADVVVVDEGASAAADDPNLAPADPPPREPEFDLAQGLAPIPPIRPEAPAARPSQPAPPPEEDGQDDETDPGLEGGTDASGEAGIGPQEGTGPSTLPDANAEAESVAEAGPEEEVAAEGQVDGPDAAPVPAVAEQTLAAGDDRIAGPSGTTPAPDLASTEEPSGVTDTDLMADTNPSGQDPSGDAMPGDDRAADSGAMIAFFDVGSPSDLAVFRRERALWVIMAANERIDVNALAADTAAILGIPEVAVARGGVALRYPDVPAGLPAISLDGTRWRLALPAAAGQAAPADQMMIDPQADFPVGARVLVDILNAAQVVEIDDPVIGDRLLVVPIPDPGRGIEPGRRFAEFDLLTSGQGLVVVPDVDDLTVRPVRDGFEIAVPGGLQLSPDRDIGESATVIPFDDTMQLFDVTGWRSGSDGYLGNRQRLLNAVASALPSQEAAARLDLARFYFAEGNGLEARGVLEVLVEDEPGLEDQPEVTALKAAVAILTGDPETGLQRLSTPPLDETEEAAIWRGLAAARLEMWPRAAQAFQMAGLDVVESYPVPYAAEVILAAAEAEARLGNVATAERLLLTLSRRTDGASDTLTRVDYIRGLIADAQGETDRAMERLAAAAQGRDTLYAVRARLERIRVGLANNLLTEEAALEAVEGLRFAWRGDSLEVRILDRLADLQWRTGAYGEALSTWEQLAEEFPEDPLTDGVDSRIDDRFIDLFTGPRFEEMSPMQAFAVFDSYRDKIPDGPQGDQILERLSDRLAEIDLLDRSSALLGSLVTERLPAGADRARVGTRLAAVEILDRRPRDALTALAATAVDAEDTGDTMMLFERRLLRAKALADLGETEVALSALEGESDPLALSARLDIAYQIGDWALAADTLDRLLGGPPPLGTALTDEERALVLNRAIALAQAGDRPGLDQMAIQYGPAMQGTPEASAFALITREEGQIPAPSDLDAIQRGVAEIDTFRDFLEQSRTSAVMPAS